MFIPSPSYHLVLEYRRKERLELKLAVCKEKRENTGSGGTGKTEISSNAKTERERRGDRKCRLITSTYTNKLNTC